MNSNEQLIEEFYAAFAAHNVKTMASCYHAEIRFEDPVFGRLKGDEVSKMWHMLIARSNGHLKIEFSNVRANEISGSANWTAQYVFSTTKRTVINEVTSTFTFKDGLIYKQIDEFDFWKWSKQAFGISGILLGWTGYMQNKIQKRAALALERFKL